MDVPHYTAAREVADRDRRVDMFYRCEDLKVRLNSTDRPVFRYFTPLGPRKFCALPPHICAYSVMFS